MSNFHIGGFMEFNPSLADVVKPMVTSFNKLRARVESGTLDKEERAQMLALVRSLQGRLMDMADKLT